MPRLPVLSPADAELARELAAMAPPSNFTPPALLDPNYVPPNRGHAIIAVTVASTSVVVFVVALRLYVRINQVLKWDDYTIALATVLAVGQMIVCILMVTEGGAGKHSYDITIPEFVKEAPLGFILVLFYHAAACATKLSIVLFLYRLFEPLRPTKTPFYGLGIFYSSLFVTAILLNFLQCSPHAASWDLRVRAKGAKCANEFASGLALSLFYIIGDIILVSIPTVTVWRLNLRRTAKFGAIFLLSLGGLSCVFCLWKLVYLQGVLKDSDSAWTLVYVLILFQMEINLGIIATSLPTANVLFMHAYKSLAASLKGSDGLNLSTYEVVPRPESTTKSEILGTSLSNRDNDVGSLRQKLNTTVSALPAQPMMAYLEEGRSGSEQDSFALDSDLRGSTGCKK